jgi:hypothetical protein
MLRRNVWVLLDDFGWSDVCVCTNTKRYHNESLLGRFTVWVSASHSKDPCCFPVQQGHSCGDSSWLADEVIKFAGWESEMTGAIRFGLSQAASRRSKTLEFTEVRQAVHCCSFRRIGSRASAVPRGEGRKPCFAAETPRGTFIVAL